MTKDKYGEEIKVNDRLILVQGGTGYVPMNLYKIIVTRVSKHTIWGAMTSAQTLKVRS